MPATDSVQRVRIYLSEGDEVSGQPLYLATLERLREAGATGATALRGIAGFGASHQLHTTQTSNPKSLPIIIEWVDRTERIARVLPSLDALLPTALITVETLQIYRAALRSSGPFGERSVGELAVRDGATATDAETLLAVVTRLVTSRQQTLPILNNGRLVGIVGAHELRRSQLPTLERLRAMNETECASLLQPAASVPLAAAMSSEVLALTTDASVVQAAKTMVEWGLDELPIITRDGTFHGTFGIDQALWAAHEARAPSEGAIRTADQPAPIGILMQAARHTVIGYARAADELEKLLGSSEQPLVVVDNGQPLGIIWLNTLLRATDEPLRSLFHTAQIAATNRATLREGLGETRVASLPLDPLPTLPLNAGYDTAIGVLRDTGSAWLAAVDELGKLQGLVGRSTLLRALVQESGA